MHWLEFTLWTYLIFVLHSALRTMFSRRGYAPHLVLAGLILMCARNAGRAGICLAALWGLLADCLSEGRLGPGLMIFVLSAFVIGHCNAAMEIDIALANRRDERASRVRAARLATLLGWLLDGHLPDRLSFWETCHAAGSALSPVCWWR